MRTGFHRKFQNARAAAILVIVLATPAALAQTLLPVSQYRSVDGMVIVPPCNGSPTSDSAEASDFGPFRQSIDVSRICDFAHGIAQSQQQSSINPASLIAYGQADCNVFSVNNTIIHSIPSSFFDVAFELTAASAYAIDATLAAEGDLPVVVAYSRLRLTDAGNATIVDHIVEPGRNGRPNSLTLNQAGNLEPGAYRLRLDAAAIVDSQVPPGGTGQASFDAVITFQRAGDANIDGFVNLNDLLMVINAWGACPSPCPPACPADLTHDCSVNVNDLLQVLNHWG